MSEDDEKISRIRVVFYWLVNKITTYPSDKNIRALLAEVRNEITANKGKDNNFSHIQRLQLGCCVLFLPEGSGYDDHGVDVLDEDECRALVIKARLKYPGINYRKPFISTRNCS